MRLAQLSAGPRFASVQPFVPKRWGDLQEFSPNIVVGSLDEMHRLADHAAGGAFDPSSIDRALVILTRYGSNPLRDIERVMLWQTFGVPLFELYLGLDHSLLASECEAHEGWHCADGVRFITIESGELILDGAGNAGLRTGLSAKLDESSCPCGATTTRILEVESLSQRPPRYSAASA